MGGYTVGKKQSFYQLQMSNLDNNEWKWSKMSSTIDKRSWTSMTLIEDDKIFVVGGFDLHVGALRSVEIFDFEQSEWNKGKIKQLRRKRCRNGIVYSEEFKRVFVSGGRAAEHSTEWYDFEQNKWLDNIPHLRYKIDHYPAMWLQSRDVLFVASACADCLQWIDLRINKKWNVICGKGRNKMPFSETFGVPYSQNDFAQLIV